MQKLRETLLSEIIGVTQNYINKYSIGIRTMEGIMNLELKEKQSSKLPEKVFETFNIIKKDSMFVHERCKNIPLLILEQYYYRNEKNLSKYLNIEYTEIINSKEITIECECTVSELYLWLENYYMRIYMLAIEIADYYSIDIKLKQSLNNVTVF